MDHDATNDASARTRLDLAQWERLAREDPAQFERRRREAIEAVISQAPQALQPRLRGLQFRIDLERARAKTALGAAVRLHAMMWDEFQALRDALNGLAQLDLRPGLRPSSGAQVIPFRPRS